VALRLPLLGGGQIDYDEGVYWESLRSLSAGHPLFSSVYSSQQPAFLPLLAPFFALGHSLPAARAGVLFFFVVALLAGYVTAHALLGPRAALATLVVLAVDPLLLRQSVALQADGPAVALGMLGLALIALASRAGAATTRRDDVLRVAGGAALALAVLVKLLAVVFLVPAIFVLFLAPNASSRPPWRTAAQQTAWVALGAVLGAAAVLLPVADRLRLAWSQSVGGHLSARTLREGGLTHDMALALARESPFYLAALLGVVLLLRRAPRLGAVPAAWAVAVAALAIVQHPLWPHHLVVATPLAALAIATLAAHAWRRPTATRMASAAALACLVVAGLATGLPSLDTPFTADTHPDAVAALRRLTRPGDRILSDDPFAVAAADRETPPELVDTSFVRIDSEPLTARGIEAIAQRDDVAAVYVGTGRLPHIEGLLDWVRAHYPHATRLRDGTVVYTRVGA
jgi:4-amino-4-deoxy-L-arabinose transferase-like glycosyltransferase